MVLLTPSILFRVTDNWNHIAQVTRSKHKKPSSRLGFLVPLKSASGVILEIVKFINDVFINSLKGLCDVLLQLPLDLH